MRALKSVFSRQRNRCRASVLVIVLVTIVFTALALTVFIDKASTDLIVETRAADARRLRSEAYSALEVTLAVLEDFRIVNGALRSPAEGWQDPLGFAGLVPSEGRTVEVTLEDESGRISLPRAQFSTLLTLFESWELPQHEAEELADALMEWMHKEHIPKTGAPATYEHSEIPYAPPGRPLRSFRELAAIDRISEKFYDEDGRPNEFWHRFVQAVSLFDYRRPNLNSAGADVLAAVGRFDRSQQQQLEEYLSGKGVYSAQNQPYFRSTEDAQSILGPQSNVGDFDTRIQALRIRVTVRDGRSVFHVNAVVAPQGGAQIVESSAVTNPTTENQATAQPESPSARAATPRAGATRTGNNGSTAQRNLNYPFTVLEIRENGESLSAPPPPPDA